MTNYDDNPDKPTHESYVEWYEGEVLIDLDGGATEAWYEAVTEEGRQQLENSVFGAS